MSQPSSRPDSAADLSPRRALWYEVLPGEDVIVSVRGLEAVTGEPTPGERLPRSWWAERVHPDDYGPAFEAKRRGIEEGRDHVLLYRVRHADGSWRHVEDHVRILPSENGKDARVVGVVVDVTPQREREEGLRGRLREVGILAGLSRALLEAGSRDEIHEAALDAVTSALGAERASLLLFDDAGEMRFVAWWGLSDAYRNAVEGHTPWEPGERGAEPIVVEDVERDPELVDHLETFRSEAIRAMVFVPLLSSDGVIGKFMVYFRDPRQIERAERTLLSSLADQVAAALLREAQRAELEASSARFRAFFRSTTAGLVEIEPGTGRILDANEAYCELAGRSREELLGLSVIDLAHPEDREAVARDVARPHDPDEEHPVLEKRFHRPDGSIAWALVYASEAPGRTGGAPVLLKTVADVTRHRELEEELRRARDEADEANRARGEFVASVSHELRTPLNAVIGYTDLLRRGIPVEIPPEALQHVERTALSARHLKGLIDDVLSFSRLEAGREPVDPEPLELAEVLQEVEAVLRPLADQAGLDFAIRAPEERTVVECDPAKLRQVLINLLGNAVKFTSEGSVSLEVEQRGEDVVFVVRDTGPGFTREEETRAFEPFWQGSGRGDSRRAGSGLGLAITRRLVRLMGGGLELESEPDEGSVFTVRIPARSSKVAPSA